MRQCCRMKQNSRKELGYRGEELASEYLSRQGLVLLEQNWRDGKNGEIDLIMRQGDEVVFIEVKTRRDQHLLAIGEVVDTKKLFRLQRLARAWLHQNEVSAPHRIDMVGIVFRGEEPRIFWWKAIER